MLSDSTYNELLFINLATVRAERNANISPAQSRKTCAISDSYFKLHFYIMNQIFKLTFVIVAITFFQSCKKDDDLAPPKDDYSFFLNTSEYMFRGTLPDSSVQWKYGIINDFQKGASSTPLGSEERPQKSLSFDLLSNRDLSTRIAITTPSYDVQSGELFSKTIAEGEKEIGGTYDKFELALTINKKLFTTKGDQTNSMLKVLKTEKSKDYFDTDVVLVWFKVNCTFYSTVDTSSFELKDGYLLAGFMFNL